MIPQTRAIPSSTLSQRILSQIPGLRWLASRPAEAPAHCVLDPLEHQLENGPINEETRTEDIRFSPSGNMIAIASTDGLVMLFSVDLRARPIQVTFLTELRSDTMKLTHGVDFVSEDMIVTANRIGKVTFYRIPRANRWDRTTQVETLYEVNSDWFGEPTERRQVGTRMVVTGPGAVRVWGNEIFVCCSLKNTVTAHPLIAQGDGIATGEGRLVAQNGIEIPDCAAISHDGSLIAVSDHDNRRILVFRRGTQEPLASLRDPKLIHAHGLCFSLDSNTIFSTDSADKSIYAFWTSDGWTSDLTAAAFSIQAVPDAVYDKTMDMVNPIHRALEGGTKGMALDPSGRVLAVTCRNQVLKFFDVASISA